MPQSSKAEAEIQERMAAIVDELASAGLPIEHAKDVVVALEKICLNCINQHLDVSIRK
jgi:hypothetical protein